MSELSKNAQEILDKVELLSLIEATDLIKAMEEKFGVSAAAPVVMAGNATNGEAEEAKSTFDVELTSAGESKIAVIKVIKEITGLGLKESKDLVDAAPKVIKENVKKEDAKDMKKKIEAVGGVVTLK